MRVHRSCFVGYRSILVTQERRLRQLVIARSEATKPSRAARWTISGLLGCARNDGRNFGGSYDRHGFHPLPTRSVQARTVRGIFQALAFNHPALWRPPRWLLDAA